MPARGYGDNHHREAMALSWARAVQGCQLHHQSCNPLDPRGKAEAWSTKDNLAKNCGSGNEEHESQLGAPSRGWPVTDRGGGGASLLPYTPPGMTGSDDDDDDECQYTLVAHHYSNTEFPNKNQNSICILLIATWVV